MKFQKFLSFICLSLTLIGCASVKTNTEFYTPIIKDIKHGEYKSAVVKIENAEKSDEYGNKDRVLKYLDKGIIYHYAGDFEKSNKELEAAEYAMEELFTKSISKGAASILLNDNALDYAGEVYENLYINIFKALNYIQLKKFDDAYVEVRRVNNKLKELEVKYEDYVESLNSSDDKKFDIDPVELDYFNNVLANYMSHIILRADGNEDGSRISLEKLNEAWEAHSDVYNYAKPFAVDSTTTAREFFLNIIAFAGNAPVKVPIGARITTFNDLITITDPTNFHGDAIPFPGVKGGYNFKFEFPEIEEEGTLVYSIRVKVDSQYVGELELLENMCRVAKKTFEQQKSITYFKTAARAVLKGISANALGNKAKKGSNGFLGELMAAAINVASDLSENADLRCWRTMPGYSFVGEFPINKGIHNIELGFFDGTGKLLYKKTFENYNVAGDFNLLEAFYLN
ncbi:MAG: hypothetical protein JEY94_11315 [Melioribacteraceae bacterium]|nr:hypothetical protein [Melioribacteraceae bacterium]